MSADETTDTPGWYWWCLHFSICRWN